MRGSVTVITPTIPGRESQLERCQLSVAAQTVAVTHLVGVDADREGPSVIRNRLAASTDADWLLPLDDDDTADPTLVERLLEASEDADVVYPWCRMDGRTDGWVPNKLFNRDSLHKMNFIPVTALIRRDTFRMLAGYRKVQMEDWDLWRRAELHDVRFRCLPEVLWTYWFQVNTFQAEAA